MKNVKSRYYAIYLGHGDGIVIHKSWNDIKEQVSELLRGNPQAKQHGFDNEKDAKTFAKHGYDEKDKALLLENERLNKQVDQDIASLSEDEVIAFTDGSYLSKINKAGYGALVFTNRGLKLPYQLCGPVTEETESRNIAGEALAVERAVEWALDHNKKHITIYHDYAYVDAYKNADVSKPVLKKYYDWFNKKKDLIDIKFFKVTAHSNVTHNNEVNHLAKAGARGIEKR